MRRISEISRELDNIIQELSEAYGEGPDRIKEGGDDNENVECLGLFRHCA